MPDLLTLSRPARVSGLRVALAALGWGVAAGVTAAVVWVVVLVVAQFATLGPIWLMYVAKDVAGAAFYAALYGGACGLLTGGVAGSILTRSGRTAGVIGWALGMMVVGAVGGSLCPLLIVAIGDRLPPEVSSAPAWFVAGLLAGVGGYWRNWLRTSPDDWPDGEDAGEHEPAVGIPFRLLPVLGVSVVCLVLAVATPRSDVGWAILAVGLLGLAAAWALNGQERRIRELEHQLREREKPTF